MLASVPVLGDSRGVWLSSNYFLQGWGGSNYGRQLSLNLGSYRGIMLKVLHGRTSISRQTVTSLAAAGISGDEVLCLVVK